MVFLQNFRFRPAEVWLWKLRPMLSTLLQLLCGFTTRLHRCGFDREGPARASVSPIGFGWGKRAACIFRKWSRWSSESARLRPTLAKPTLTILIRPTLAKIGVSILSPSFSKKTEQQDVGPHPGPPPFWEGWGPRRVGPRRVGPGGARKGGGPKFRFFFPLRPQFRSFVSLLVSSRGILVVFEAPGLK